MNITEWNKACKEGWAPRRYDNASREIQRTLKYNSNPNATVRHHLRDTEEQRKYNDEHYELWGFEIDENGNEHFEYGKYVIFVTEKEHNAIHALSEETRKKIGDANRGENNGMYNVGLYAENNGMYGKHHTEEAKRLISERNKQHWADTEYYNRVCEKFRLYWTEEKRFERSMLYSGENHPMCGKHHTEESKKKMSEARTKFYQDHPDAMLGENNPMYGRHHTEEHKKKISEKMKDYWTDEKRLEYSNKFSGENSPMYGKHLSDEAKRKLSESHKGKATWNKCKKTSEDVKLKIKQSSIGKHNDIKLVAEQYKAYKSAGGDLSWNDFQKYYKEKLVSKNTGNDEAKNIGFCSSANAVYYE